ncbi:right-handed parallel beta-helix repeat-containing protein [Leptobacterium sp. I13]|uniref:right-handed parallel beta-helix repeat-containing protein n=1 Tax=Leptobacterium meishanense TaxID=3128904 RepID=UPI0030EEAA0A
MRKQITLAVMLLLILSCTREEDVITIVDETAEEVVDNENDTTEEESTEEEPPTDENGETPPEETPPPSDVQGVKASTFGYNETDATSAFVAALTSDNDTIVIDKQASDWIIKPTRITNISNKFIFFEEGVVLKAKRGAFPNTNDALLQFINGHNITIIGYGATFDMNKDEYTSGEWRHTLSLRGSTDITVKGLTLQDSGGDGIYVAGSSQKSYSENIIVEDIQSINHRRQGMSIISVQNMWVRNSLFTETKGALPEAGVDIEPNNPIDRVVNVNFSDCSFTNNHHSGILLALFNLDDTSEPVSISFKDCFLSMNHDESNRYAASEIGISAHDTRPVKGTVTFDGIVIDGSEWGMLYSRKIKEAFHVTFKNSVARNISLADTHPPINLEVPSYDYASGPLGGFTFENLRLDYGAKEPFFQVRGHSTLLGVSEIHGDIIVNGSNAEPPNYTGYDPSKNKNVTFTYTINR